MISDSPQPRRLGRRGAFWASAAVLALTLWSSGAPSTLYPLYAEQWALSPFVISAIFATYQLTLILVLPVFGSLSDKFGRRVVMIWSVAFIAASAIIFAVAPNVFFLCIGRALQGIGAGLAMGAATASLVENNIGSHARFASSMATISTATGLTLALMLSGVLAQFVAMPLVLSYLVLLVLSVLSIVALILTPDDRPINTTRWRPQAMKLPATLRLSFTIATLSVCLAYCVGAIFLSLGAHMISQFTQTDNIAIIGILLGCSSAAIGITALLLARVPANAAVWAGAALTIVSLVTMAAAASFGSIAMFLGWCLIGGMAYSFAFTGGLGVINRVAPEHQRGQTLSLLYLIAYVLQAATAIGVGALATASTLGNAVSVAAVVLCCLCVTVLGLMALDVQKNRRARHSLN